MARSESRIRLREFQARLAERLAQAKNAPVSASRLGFQVNEERYLIALDEAGEIVPALDIVPVPHTHPWFLGVINVRGSLVSVCDLSIFGGHGPTRVQRESRIVSFSPALEFNAGIVVTRMLGLHSLDKFVRREAVSGDACWADEEGQIWHELSFESLASSERFLRISAL